MRAVPRRSFSSRVDRHRRRVAAQRRSRSRPSCASGVPRLGRPPEPRRGRRPPLRPELRRPAGDARARAPARRPRARGGGLRGGAAAGVRAFVVPGRRGRGRGRGEADDRAPRRPRRESSARRSSARTAWACSSRTGRRPWIGAPPDTTAPRARRRRSASPARSRTRSSRSGGRVGLPLRRLLRRRGRDGRGRLSRVLRRGRRDARDRALPRDRAAARRLRGGARAAARTPGKPVVCLKVGRSEAGGRVALSHTGALVGSDRAFSAVLRRYGAIEVDDFHELVETLEVLGRDRRPQRHADRRRSPSRAASARSSPTTPRPRASRSSRCRTELAAQLPAEFPNYLAPGQPARRVGGRGRDRACTRARSSSWPRRARSTSSSRRSTSPSSATETNDEWCELDAAHARATRATSTTLFGAMTTVHSVDPPRRASRTSRTSATSPLLRGPRDAHARARGVAAGGRCAPASRAAPRHRTSPTCSPARARCPSSSRLAILERYGVPFAERRRASTPDEAAAASRSSACPVVVKLDGVAHKAPRRRRRPRRRTAEEAAEAARRARRARARRAAGRARRRRRSAA